VHAVNALGSQCDFTRERSNENDDEIVSKTKTVLIRSPRHSTETRDAQVCA